MSVVKNPRKCSVYLSQHVIASPLTGGSTLWCGVWVSSDNPVKDKSVLLPTCLSFLWKFPPELLRFCLHLDLPLLQHVRPPLLDHLPHGAISALLVHSPPDVHGYIQYYISHRRAKHA